MTKSSEYPQYEEGTDIMNFLLERMANGIVKSYIPTPSQEGTSAIGLLVSSVLHIIFGKTMSKKGYHYRGTPQGNAIMDSMKIMRLLTYIFVNMIIVVFFKDSYTLKLLEEHNTIDTNILGLGISLREIHNTFMNGILAMIVTIVNDEEASGELETTIRKIFDKSNTIDKFETILGLKDNDYYGANNHNNEKGWNESFTKVLYNGYKNGGNYKREKKNKNDLTSKTSIKKYLKENGVKDVNKILSVLSGENLNDAEEQPNSQENIYNSNNILYGGSDKPTDNESLKYIQKTEKNHIYYKLFLIENIMRSDKFLDAFVVSYNIIARVINRTIRILIPLTRKLGQRAFQNIGAFIFSLGGPFTEILWFTMSSSMAIFDIGSAITGITDLLDDVTPSQEEKRYNPGKKQKAIEFQGHEKKELNEILDILASVYNNKRYVNGIEQNKSKTQNGGSILKSFESKIIEAFYKYK